MTQTETGGSVTGWFRHLQAGQIEGLSLLWERYYQQLAEFADKRISSIARKIADGEDVAAKVLLKLSENARKGRYPHLQDRDELWLLMLSIARCEIVSQERREWRLKRGNGRIVSEAGETADGESGLCIDQLADKSVGHDALTCFYDAVEHLLKQLNNEKMRDVAVLKMSGLKNEEVAKELNIGLRSVERKLSKIRKRWGKDLGIEIEGAADDQDSTE